ncbi:MAG: TolC family protein [Pyrinomonadaceae bacterium]
MLNRLQAIYFNFQEKFSRPTRSLSGAACVIFFAVGIAAAQTTQNPPPAQQPPPTQPTEVQQQVNPPQTTQQQRQPTSPNQVVQPNQQPNPSLTTTTTQTQTAQPNQPATQITQTTTTPSSAINPAAPVLTNATPTQSVGASGGIAPAVLPDDPPPIAPNFQAPNRPLPSAERVGVDVTDQLPLSLQDAITLALQNNNDIDSSKISVKMAEFDLRAARGVYDPALNVQSYYQRATTPVASTIGGGSNGSVTQTSLVNGFGATGFSRYAGGSYALNYTGSRTTTNNQNATLNPQFPNLLSFTYTQPLWRGLHFDNNRRTIEIAKKNLSLTDAQFRQKAIEVISQVESSYWDLAYALRNLQVQIDAVKQARRQLESNERLVSKGVLAPIDIIAANTQITTFEQNVYTAQQNVTTAENVLKTLMLPERTDPIWKRALVPVSPVEVEIPHPSLDQAVGDALANRQELAQIKNNAEINKINERYYRDLTKPEIDLVGSYTANGLAGAVVPRTSTTSVLTDRINALSALSGLPPVPTTSTTTVTPNLVGGYFSSLSNLTDYPTYRVGVVISLPLRNTTAKANLGKTLAQGEQIKNQRAQQEQLIESDVRNTLQALRSSEARLQAAAASRASAEQLFESEQRQFRAGTTTVYLVLQRQTELVIARGNELQAQTLLNKAISDFQRATGTTLSANSVEISRDSSLNFIKRPPIEFGSRIFAARGDETKEQQ